MIGEDSVDPRVRAWLRPIPVMLCPQRQRHVALNLANQLRNTEARGAVIFGPAQSGRRAVTRRVAAELGLHLVELSPAFSSREPELQRTQTALLAREAALGSFALMLDVSPVSGIESGQHDRSNREVARMLLETFDGVCFVISEDRLDFAPSMPRLQLTALESDDRLALWRESLGPGANPEQMELVAEHFRFGPAEIAAVASQTPATQDLWSACRAMAGRSLENLADRIEPRFGWDDIVLPPAVIHDLRAITAQVRHQSQVFNRGGFGKKLVRGRGVIALFSGASGVGKTMAAEVIARDLGLDLCRIDLSGVVSKYIGETERHLNAIFQKMELGGAVLMFDECDALFGKRGEINDGRDRYANLEVSYLLQRIETYSGLAILATNLKGNIDSAFLRRLRYVINIPFPDTSQRLAIWRRAFPAETQTEGLDFDALARLDIAGGNIAVIAINAAFLAAADGSPVRMSHIARAAESEFRKIDKEFPSTWQVRR
jgi:ATPase family associated with various cellular activities (AAA)